MPADTLTVSLPSPLADDVRAAAEARGLTPEEYIRVLAAEGVAADADAAAFETEYNDLSWEADLRRLDEPGENVPAQELFAEIRARLEARVTAPK